MLSQSSAAVLGKVTQWTGTFAFQVSLASLSYQEIKVVHKDRDSRASYEQEFFLLYSPDSFFYILSSFSLV